MWIAGFFLLASLLVSQVAPWGLVVTLPLAAFFLALDA